MPGPWTDPRVAAALSGFPIHKSGGVYFVGSGLSRKVFYPASTGKAGRKNEREKKMKEKKEEREKKEKEERRKTKDKRRNKPEFVWIAVGPVAGN